MTDAASSPVQEIDFPELQSIPIPDKTHFKIGEVAKLLDLEPYVLRYWEKEFEILEPSKTDSGQRAYQRSDIELLATIEKLLYTEMFTIDGARRQLELARKGEFSYLTASMSEESEGGAGDDALEEIQWENEQLRLELQQTEQEHADERSRLRAEVEELEVKLERARDASEADGETVESLREEIADLRNQNDSLHQRLAEADEAIARLERENEQLQTADEGGLDDESREVVDALHGQVASLAELVK